MGGVRGAASPNTVAWGRPGSGLCGDPLARSVACQTTACSALAAAARRLGQCLEALEHHVAKPKPTRTLPKYLILPIAHHPLKPIRMILMVTT
jgi:hypothetical protein